jgi:uncharacterized protein YbcI
MAEETGTPNRTSLRNAISNAMARIKREFYGKGPSRTRTFIYDRIIISVLDDVLTPVELTLKEGGRSGLVRRLRLTFEDIMADTFTGQVERLTGARVLAYHSQIVFDPDMAIEVFVLDRPAQRDGAPAAGAGSALADAMVRIVHEHWGKGPTRAKAYVEDGFVFCVMEEPLTTVERTLVDSGETDLVRDLRMEFQDLVNHESAAQVATLTGRRVLTCHGQIVFDPDILFQIFVLDEPG